MKFYVAEEESILQGLRNAPGAKYRVGSVADLARVPPEWEIIAVADGRRAKVLAQEIVSRGISELRMNYVDLNLDEGIATQIAHPKHMRWDDVVPLSEIEAQEEQRYYKSGLGFLDMNLGWHWRLPELVVMAGAYGSGKSTIGQILAANFVAGCGPELGSGAMLCSWEDIGEEVRHNIGLHGRAIQQPDLIDRIHFVRRHPDEDRLVAWYMSLVEYHFARYGTRFFLLDPWNEMDHVKDARQNETEYVRDMMKAFRRLVDKLQIILLIATHVPAKIISGSGKVEAFKIAHAFGSVNFANKADRGLCVLRTKEFEPIHGHTILRLDKSKIERRMGNKGTVAARLNMQSFQLEYDGHVTAQVQDVWKD